MSPPSYAHRHLLCSDLLANQPDPPDFQPFVVGPAESSKSAEIRSRKLDHLLLQGWNAKGKGRSADPDADTLQRIENLRIKKADFETLGRVGEGQFGIVDAVRCRFDGKVYAMKTMDKFKVQRAGAQLSLPCERHLHIAAALNSSRRSPALVAAFQTPSSLVMVTDFAPCGTLWDRLATAPDGRLGEREVRWWTAQMVEAISWCHGQGFAHRDIKPHNFLLHPNGRLWLTDFGSAAPLTSNLYLHRSACLLPCGTADYIAPEILAFAEQAFMDAMMEDVTKAEEETGYTATCDWWSMGVVVYELVVGTAPFWAERVEDTYARIMRFGETLSLTVPISTELEQFIRGLLCPTGSRMNSATLSEHAWLQHPDVMNKTDGKAAPGWLSPLAMTDFGALPPADDASTAEDTVTQGFDRFFQSSPGLSSMSISTHSRTFTQMNQRSVQVEEHLPPWYRWLGWSWDPSPSVFSSASPLPPTPVTAIKALHRPTPGLTPGRTRPASDPKVFRQLVDCVQMSARKRFIEASAKRPSPAGIPRWEPPTPSPMPRPGGSLRGLKAAAGRPSRMREVVDENNRSTMPSYSPRPLKAGPIKAPIQVSGLEILAERHRGLNAQLENLEDRLGTLKASLS